MKKILLGNEAIVQGALEAGVEYVTTYPGTPASDIGDTFYKLPNRTYYFEYSTNEKVAMESAIGASYSGLKTLVSMKNFGLNVASDSFLPFVYTGSSGPTVLVIADDPSCHSSAQSEENTRGFANLAHVPILEPSDPAECKEFVKIAFKMSEKYKVPVMVRITTRIAHQRMPITMGKVKQGKKVGEFKSDKHRFVTMPPRVLEMKDELYSKLEAIRGSHELDLTEGKKTDIGIITSGVSYLHVKEAKKKFESDVEVLKIGVFNPINETLIKRFIKNKKKVLVIEELEPYLEHEIERLSRTINPKLKIHGKDLLKETGELKPEQVIYAVSKLLGKKYTYKEEPVKLVKHLPKFCNGCPYWGVFNVIKKLAKPDTVFGGDIGCYMMASFPPYNLYDYMLSMGSGIGIGHGIAKAQKKPVISFIGDSTFFHAGIPALINTKYNESDIFIIIMNNDITAMTGHQPYPGLNRTIQIKKIVKALDIELRVADPKNIKEFEKTTKELINKKGVRVLIAEHPCYLHYRK